MLRDFDCWIDIFKVVDIISTLVGNAVRAQGDKNIPVRVVLASSFDNLIIMVSDCGVGIEDEDRPFIYNLGFTRKEGGLGIGLYIARRFAEKSVRGSLRDLKRSDCGTRFVAKIPFIKI